MGVPILAYYWMITHRYPKALDIVTKRLQVTWVNKMKKEVVNLARPL